MFLHTTGLAIANKRGALTPPFFVFFSMLMGVIGPAIINKKGSFSSFFLNFGACGCSSANKLCSLPLLIETEEGELQLPFFVFFSMFMGAVGWGNFVLHHHQ
jgi:hypothetical protein